MSGFHYNGATERDGNLPLSDFTYRQINIHSDMALQEHTGFHYLTIYQCINRLTWTTVS